MDFAGSEVSPQTRGEEERGISLIALAAALSAGFRRLLLYGIAGAVLLGSLSFLIRNWYEGAVEILPPPLNHGNISSSMQQSIPLSTAGSMIPGLSTALQAKSQADTFVVLLQAWPIEDALIRKYDLARVYRTTTPEDARTVFGKHTELTSTKEGFVTITVRDRDRQRAAAIANTYIDESRTFLKGLALTEASQRRLFYERELDQTKQNLVQAEVAFTTVQQKGHIISLDSQAKALIENAAGLHAQIIAREVELQRLKSYSTENNPQVQIAESELDAMRRQLTRSESSAASGFTDTSLSNVPAAALEFVRANRELKYQESLYELLVKQYEESKLDEASDAPLVQIIEPAFVPQKKAGPHRFYFVLAGFVFGIGTGLVALLIRMWQSQIPTESKHEYARLQAEYKAAK